MSFKGANDSQISAIRRKNELKALLSEFRDEINQINRDSSIFPETDFENSSFEENEEKHYRNIEEEITDLLDEILLIEKKVRTLGYTKFSKEMIKVQQTKELLLNLKQKCSN